MHRELILGPSSSSFHDCNSSCSARIKRYDLRNRVILQVYYITSSRELSRLTAITEAPLFLHISESIGGATTIRAFQEQPRFAATNVLRLEAYQRAYFHNMTAAEWLGIRLDALSATLLSGVAILLITLPEDRIAPGMTLSHKSLRHVVSCHANEALVYRCCSWVFFKPFIFVIQRPCACWRRTGFIFFDRDSVELTITLIHEPAGLGGMSLSYGLSLSGLLMRLVQASSMAENRMVSVERIMQYSNIPSEAPTVIPERRPPSGWPDAGRIELRQLQASVSLNK